MKIEIKAKANGAEIFVRTDGDDKGNDEIICCDTVRFGDGYEQRLRGAIETLKNKAKEIEYMWETQNAITEKLQQEYEH